MWNLKLAVGTVKAWKVDGKFVVFARVEERRSTRANGELRINKAVRLYDPDEFRIRHPAEYEKLTECENNK